MSTYTIQAGDTFSSIAAKVGTSVAAILHANPGVDPARLQIGQVIQLQTSGKTYTVQVGDTFTSIAAKLGILLGALVAANPNVNPNNLQVGDQISLPSGTDQRPIPAPEPVPEPQLPTRVYIIQAGDTFTTIAAKFGTTAAALIASNPSLNPNNLKIGGSVLVPNSTPPPVIPPPIVPPPVVPPPVQTPANTYAIQSGDTFIIIAARFNISVATIISANPNVNPNTLQVGQIINLPAGISPPGGQIGSIGGGYIAYSGPASNFPDPSQWAPYSVLWAKNAVLMSYSDSASEIAFIGASIMAVAQESGIDARVILCMIMQESGGNVRVGNTFNGVNNTGIMQAYNGASFDPNNPSGSILQMIRDGTIASAEKPGLKQALEQNGGNYYIAARVYNSGRADLSDLNNPLGATGKYVVDLANRLMGHSWPNM